MAPEQTTGNSPKDTSAEDPSPADPDPDLEQPSKGNGLSTGSIAGIAVGGFVILCLLGIGVFLLLRRKGRKTVHTGVIPSAADSRDAYLRPNGEIQGIKYVHQLDVHSEPHMLDSRDPKPGTRPMWELQG